MLAYAGIAGDTATITLIIDAMARSMRSEANLKVRIQAMGVLLILPLSATESERLVESVEQWRESLTKEVIPSQERVHFETLSSLVRSLFLFHLRVRQWTQVEVRHRLKIVVQSFELQCRSDTQCQTLL